MITTPLLNNTEAKQRWSYIAFTVLCVALAALCWTAIGGTKSFPVSEETQVGVTAPVLAKPESWTGADFPSPIDASGNAVGSYDAANFGGAQETLSGVKVWKADGLTVYHGSHMVVDPKPSVAYQGIWFSPDFQCSLGAATTKVKGSGGGGGKGGDATVVEFTLKNTDNCKPFLLLGIGAANNAQILFENGFKKPTDQSGFVTMGRPSEDIKIQLENFCKNEAYCGWRSPWDQNEVFICSRCMADCLTSTKKIYKVLNKDVPDNMVTDYWFPNQAKFDNLGMYKDDQNKQNVVKGRAALISGETLAFYASTSYSDKVKEQEAPKENVIPNGGGAKGQIAVVKEKPTSKGVPMDELQCTSLLETSIIEDDVLEPKEISPFGCSSGNQLSFLIPLTPLSEMILEEEPQTPKSEVQKSETPKSKSSKK